MSITRADLFAAAQRAIAEWDFATMWPHVTAKPDQIGSYLTIYRRERHQHYIPLARYVLDRDEAETLTAITDYGQPTPDELAAIEALVASIEQT